MIIKIGDKVRRKWKPKLGEGRVLHILGDSYVVKWYGAELPLIQHEQLKNLRKVDESG